MADWLVPTFGLIGATMVAIANFEVQRWRYRVDGLATAINRVSDDAAAAANLATRYWLLDGTEPGTSDASRLEPEILGMQIRIQEGIVNLRRRDRRIDLAEAEQRVADLYDALTGGTFQEAGRGPDPERARDVQAAAARLSGSLGRALAVQSKRRF